MLIHMHAHYIPPKALAAIEQDATSYGIHLEHAANGGQCACLNHGLTLRPIQPRLTDLDERWRVMQQQGIDMQLLSVWADMFGYSMPADEGARWHRLLNETLGETVQQHPQRLVRVPAGETIGHQILLAPAREAFDQQPVRTRHHTRPLHERVAVARLLGDHVRLQVILR